MSQEAMELVVTALTESLKPFFKGKNSSERLTEAVAAAATSIAHLVTTRENVPNKKLGATVMTESASANKNIAPRAV